MWYISHKNTKVVCHSFKFLIPYHRIKINILILNQTILPECNLWEIDSFVVTWECCNESEKDLLRKIVSNLRN